MMPTLKLTPDAAARIYSGPRYRRRPTPAEQRRLREHIQGMKRNGSAIIRYAGAVLDLIHKLKAA
jgi:hypothetical protein